jgi:hypothetical protein
MLIFARVPRWGFNTVVLEDDRLWHCPHRYNAGGMCGHTINLWALTDEEVNKIPEPVGRVLRKPAGKWRISDPWIYNALRKLVDEHWAWHLDQVNIRRYYQKAKNGKITVRALTNIFALWYLIFAQVTFHWKIPPRQR